jgi:hypothetical protein
MIVKQVLLYTFDSACSARAAFNRVNVNQLELREVIPTVALWL